MQITFFLGTDRGKLLIYKVSKPEDCLNVEVFITPCWDVQVCNGNITSLAIAEPTRLQRNGPVIVCATPEDIYFVHA